MTKQAKIWTFVVLWTVVMAVAILFGTNAYVDRLPEPMAGHWGLDGADRTMSVTTLLVTAWVMTGAGAVAAAVLAATGWVWRRRVNRRLFFSSLGAWGGFTLGLAAAIIHANLDLAHWQDSQFEPFTVVFLLVPAILAGLLGLVLAGNAPDEPRPSGNLPMMDLASGETAVWTGRVTSLRLLLVIMGMFLIAIVALAILMDTYEPAVSYSLILSVIPVLLAALCITSIGVTAGRGGVKIRFGVLGMPSWRIRLDQIESAETKQVNALNVGGWGARITPIATAVMLRGGESLVLHRVNRRDVIISVDDAEQAAALINALISGRDKAKTQ